MTKILNQGSPHPEFYKAMEAEHCLKGGSDMQFTTGNYHITTTPINEWRIVVECNASLGDMRHNRRIPDLQKACGFDLALKAQLRNFEIEIWKNINTE